MCSLHHLDQQRIRVVGEDEDVGLVKLLAHANDQVDQPVAVGQEGGPVAASRSKDYLALFRESHPRAACRLNPVHRRSLRGHEPTEAFGQHGLDPSLPPQPLPTIKGASLAVHVRNRDLNQVAELAHAPSGNACQGVSST
jgi:hypothetical protein